MDQIERELLEFQREIRDPIYGYIPVTELECIVMDTSEFQRLDRIRQMHAGYKVYPNARYSRKAHSLGAMHLAGKAIARLLYLQDTTFASLVPSPLFAGKNSRKDYRETLDNLDFLRGIPVKIKDVEEGSLKTFETGDYRDAAKASEDVDREGAGLNKITESAAWIVQAVRLIGLLHDAGHGPFSHMIESIDEVEFNHNEITPKVVEEIENSVVDRMEEKKNEELKEFSSQMLDFVRLVLENGNDLDEDIRFLYELTDFPFDIDMLDYLVRDSYFAGTPEYGQIDAERIIRGFVIKDGSLRISRSAMTAVNDALDSYFEMYKAVYTHKTVVMYEILLSEAFEEFNETSGIPFIKEDGIDVDEFLDYDDRKLVSDIESTDAASESWGKFEKFQDRRKPYKQLLHYSLTVNTTGFKKDRQEKTSKELDELIGKTARDQGATLPHRSINEIKRAGISLDRLRSWATTEVIYDPDYEESAQAFQSFTDANTEMSKRLMQIEVNIRIFLPKDNSVIESKVKEELEEKFDTYEKELQQEMDAM